MCVCCLCFACLLQSLFVYAGRTVKCLLGCGVGLLVFNLPRNHGLPRAKMILVEFEVVPTLLENEVGDSAVKNKVCKTSRPKVT